MTRPPVGLSGASSGVHDLLPGRLARVRRLLGERLPRHRERAAVDEAAGDQPLRDDARAAGAAEVDGSDTDRPASGRRAAACGG